jgi:hypothetical protein
LNAKFCEIFDKFCFGKFCGTFGALMNAIVHSARDTARCFIHKINVSVEAIKSGLREKGFAMKQFAVLHKL